MTDTTEADVDSLPARPLRLSGVKLMLLECTPAEPGKSISPVWCRVDASNGVSNSLPSVFFPNRLKKPVFSLLAAELDIEARFEATPDMDTDVEVGFP